MGKTKWTTSNMPSQQGRVAVVTGANSGIGFETARALAEKGATVVLACRSASRGEEAVRRILDAEITGAALQMRVDLADLASVREFCEGFDARFHRLDLLINNAGIMMPPFERTVDGFESQFGTNHLGHFALTGRLLPKLRTTEGSRLVQVSSLTEKTGRLNLDDPNWESRSYRRWDAYAASKLANLLFMFELQRRFERTGDRTIAVAAHPGWTGTDLQRHMGIPRFIHQLFPMKPKQGALPTLFAATASDVHGGDYFGPVGFLEIRGYPKRVQASRNAQDRDLARRLFEICEEMTEVQFDL